MQQLFVYVYLAVISRAKCSVNTGVSVCVFFFPVLITWSPSAFIVTRTLFTSAGYILLLTYIHHLADLLLTTPAFRSSSSIRLAACSAALPPHNPQHHHHHQLSPVEFTPPDLCNIQFTPSLHIPAQKSSAQAFLPSVRGRTGTDVCTDDDDETTVFICLSLYFIYFFYF